MSTSVKHGGCAVMILCLLGGCGTVEPRDQATPPATESAPAPESAPEPPAPLPPLADELPTGGTDTAAVRDAGAPPPPRIRPGSIMLGGPPISHEVIRRIIKRHQAEVDACFATARAANAELAGSVKIKFIIDGDGTVKLAAVARNTTGDEPLGACLKDAVASWRFPQPEGGGIMITDYEFAAP